MQHTTKVVSQKQSVIRKKFQRGLPKDIISYEKSQPGLQNRQQSGLIVPSTNDILCGKGKSFFNHEGNKRFRDIVDKYINAYIQASKRSKRSEIVKAVVNETFGIGARFLKKSENKLEWYDGGEKLAKEKVRALDFIPLKSYP